MLLGCLSSHLIKLTQWVHTKWRAGTSLTVSNDSLLTLLVFYFLFVHAGLLAHRDTISTHVNIKTVGGERWVSFVTIASPTPLADPFSLTLSLQLDLSNQVWVSNQRLAVSRDKCWCLSTVPRVNFLTNFNLLTHSAHGERWDDNSFSRVRGRGGTLSPSPIHKHSALYPSPLYLKVCVVALNPQTRDKRVTWLSTAIHSPNPAKGEGARFYSNWSQFKSNCTENYSSHLQMRCTSITFSTIAREDRGCDDHVNGNNHVFDLTHYFCCIPWNSEFIGVFHSLN